jgi:small subunit ribosomal protein S17
MQHTVVVEVSVVRAHPLYKKRFTKKKKYYAHNADNIAKVGDTVKIREVRPLSKLKRWNMVEVVTKSVV